MKGLVGTAALGGAGVALSSVWSVTTSALGVLREKAEKAAVYAAFFLSVTFAAGYIVTH